MLKHSLGRYPKRVFFASKVAGLISIQIVARLNTHYPIRLLVVYFLSQSLTIYLAAKDYRLCDEAQRSFGEHYLF